MKIEIEWDSIEQDYVLTAKIGKRVILCERLSSEEMKDLHYALDEWWVTRGKKENEVSGLLI